MSQKYDLLEGFARPGAAKSNVSNLARVVDTCRLRPADWEELNFHLQLLVEVGQSPDARLSYFLNVHPDDVILRLTSAEIHRLSPSQLATVLFLVGRQHNEAERREVRHVLGQLRDHIENVIVDRMEELTCVPW